MSTRASNQAETRERLVEAAFHEFSERRVADVTIDQIARRAGYTKGAVYSNFDSKTELLFAALESRLSTRRDRYPKVLTEEADADLPSIVGELSAGRDPENRRYLRVLAAAWAEAVHDPVAAERVLELQERYRNQLAGAIVRRAADVGRRTTFDPELLAAGIMSMGIGISLEGLVDDELDGVAVYATMLDVLLAGAYVRSEALPDSPDDASMRPGAGSSAD